MLGRAGSDAGRTRRAICLTCHPAEFTRQSYSSCLSRLPVACPPRSPRAILERSAETFPSGGGRAVARDLAGRARRARPRARRGTAARRGDGGGLGGHQCVGRRPRGGVQCDRGKGDAALRSGVRRPLGRRRRHRRRGQRAQLSEAVPRLPDARTRSASAAVRSRRPRSLRSPDPRSRGDGSLSQPDSRDRRQRRTWRG